MAMAFSKAFSSSLLQVVVMVVVVVVVVLVVAVVEVLDIVGEYGFGLCFSLVQFIREMVKKMGSFNSFVIIVIVIYFWVLRGAWDKGGGMRRLRSEVVKNYQLKRTTLELKGWVVCHVHIMLTKGF